MDNANKEVGYIYYPGKMAWFGAPSCGFTQDLQQAQLYPRDFVYPGSHSWVWQTPEEARLQWKKNNIKVGSWVKMPNGIKGIVLDIDTFYYDVKVPGNFPDTFYCDIKYLEPTEAPDAPEAEPVPNFKVGSYYVTKKREVIKAHKVEDNKVYIDAGEAYQSFAPFDFLERQEVHLSYHVQEQIDKHKKHLLEIARRLQAVLNDGADTDIKDLIEEIADGIFDITIPEAKVTYDG